MIGLHCYCPRISALPVRVVAVDGVNALVTEIGYTSEHEVKYDELNFTQKIDAIRHFDNKVKCLDHGFVRLVDAMPRLYSGTMDYAILEAARVSYDANSKSHTWEEDRGLIRYLIRHSHTTPLEMCEFKMHCRMPLFVARQWIRHRTANVNEWSARYTPMLKQFYIPELEQVRAQSKSNKQGGEIPVSENIAKAFMHTLEQSSNITYQYYETYLKGEIANELSRLVLPVNYYTEWYWKIDLHNLLHFLKLRCDSHAQYEIRVFADAMLKLITPHLPWTIEAWNDFNPYRQALTLSALEIEALQNGTNILSPRATKREISEWNSKLGRIGKT